MLAEHARTSGALPATLARMPELEPALAPYWQAFQDLSPSRRLGLDIGPIPLSEIWAYLEILGIDETERRHDMVRFIRALDDEYLTVHRARAGKG